MFNLRQSILAGLLFLVFGICSNNLSAMAVPRIYNDGANTGSENLNRFNHHMIENLARRHAQNVSRLDRAQNVNLPAIYQHTKNRLNGFYSVDVPELNNQSRRVFFSRVNIPTASPTNARGTTNDRYSSFCSSAGQHCYQGTIDAVPGFDPNQEYKETLIYDTTDFAHDEFYKFSGIRNHQEESWLNKSNVTKLAMTALGLYLLYTNWRTVRSCGAAYIPSILSENPNNPYIIRSEAAFCALKAASWSATLKYYGALASLGTFMFYMPYKALKSIWNNIPTPSNPRLRPFDEARNFGDVNS